LDNSFSKVHLYIKAYLHLYVLAITAAFHFESSELQNLSKKYHVEHNNFSILSALIQK